MILGELGTGFLQVGRHIPPDAEALPRFLDRFAQAYDKKRLSKVRRITALGAAHHRFLRIHSFYDGNGRVARLILHALLQWCGVGSSLWSTFRGLARNVKDYKALLMAADGPRQGALDGRGTLSTRALIRFCEFFLIICIDQIDFMASLLEPGDFLRRTRPHIEEKVPRGRARRRD